MDGTFATADYPTAFSFVSNDTTPGQTGTVSDGSGPAQCAACGDPGNALQTIFTITAAGNTTVLMDIGVINAAFFYDPGTMGALQFVSGSADVSESNSNPGFPNEGQFQILIEQGANFYRSMDAFFVGNGFNHLSLNNLAAGSFDQLENNGSFDASSHPDFNGGEMEFGLYMIGGVLGAPANTETLVYDNLTFDLAPTPEPASLLLTAPALAALALEIRRRGRQSN